MPTNIFEVYERLNHNYTLTEFFQHHQTWILASVPS